MLPAEIAPGGRKLVSQEGLKRHPDLACIVQALRTRCTAIEDRSGIDPATQSKELQTFHAKINSVSVTERKKHKSKRDKIWTCAFSILTRAVGAY